MYLVVRRKTDESKGKRETVGGRKFAPLHQVIREGLTNKVPFRGLKEVKEGTMEICEGETFQAKGTVSAKTLKRNLDWCVYGIARNQMWLELNE